jgi:hypothetical protein
LEHCLEELSEANRGLLRRMYAAGESAQETAAATDAAVPRNESAATPLARLVFTQDYFCGTRDAKGNGSLGLSPGGQLPLGLAF